MCLRRRKETAEDVMTIASIATIDDSVAQPKKPRTGISSFAGFRAAGHKTSGLSVETHAIEERLLIV